MLRVADNTVHTQRGGCALSKAPVRGADSLQVMGMNIQEARREIRSGYPAMHSPYSKKVAH